MCGYLVSVVVEVVSVDAVPFAFLCFLAFLVFIWLLVVVDDVVVFWPFLAAGAAIRKGTATAVRMDVCKKRFIVLFSLNFVPVDVRTFSKAPG